MSLHPPADLPIFKIARRGRRLSHPGEPAPIISRKVFGRPCTWKRLNATTEHISAGPGRQWQPTNIGFQQNPRQRILNRSNVCQSDMRSCFISGGPFVRQKQRSKVRIRTTKIARSASVRATNICLPRRSHPTRVNRRVLAGDQCRLVRHLAVLSVRHSRNHEIRR